MPRCARRGGATRGANPSGIEPWGASAVDAVDAAAVAIPAADAECDGNTVTCHSGMNEHVRPSNIDGQL